MLTEAARFVNNHRGSVAAGIAFGGLWGGSHLPATVWNAHPKSHGVTELSPFAQTVTDTILATGGVTADTWMPAHTASTIIDDEHFSESHHGDTDTSRDPMRRIEHLYRLYENDPERYDDYPRLPEDEPIANVEPYAKLTLREIRAIGSISIRALEIRMGDQYLPPTEFNLEEAASELDTSKPMYTYGPAKRHKGEYTFQEKAATLSRDTYSPSLEPITDKVRNGIYGIKKHNTERFRGNADMMRAHPELIPKIHQDVENKSLIPAKKGIAISVGAVVGGTLLWNKFVKKRSPAETVTRSAAFIAPAIRMFERMAKKGGEITNAIGHAGRIKPRDMIRAWFNRPVELKPNYDGSMTTTIEYEGLWWEPAFKAAWWALNLFAAGEPSGQDAHHRWPWRRRYTNKEGAAAYAEQPVTTALEDAANRKHFRFGLRPGKHFGLQPGQRRPDEKNRVVRDIIEPARVRTLYPDRYTDEMRQRSEAAVAHYLGEDQLAA